MNFKIKIQSTEMVALPISHNFRNRLIADIEFEKDDKSIGFISGRYELIPTFGRVLDTDKKVEDE